ncbi:MAG TPA: hypothetical protein VGZ00_00110 [Candidatus Baltobacteraceae bacterium]|jgi:hypothetical protein|nr:hypothetical protein [Candidatus Baltobacteraceae bacterium]
MPEPALVGVGLLPTGEDRKRIIQLEKATRSWGRWRGTLNESDCWPHLSLLHANVIDCENVVIRAARIVEESGIEKKILATVANAEYVERGWYFLNIASSGYIERLHRIIFNEMKNLIFPGVINDQSSLSHYRSVERESFLKYGYRYMLSAYHPHITLGRTNTKERSIEHDRLIPMIENYRGSRLCFDEIVIFRLGKNGVMLEKIWGKQLLGRAIDLGAEGSSTACARTFAG